MMKRTKPTTTKGATLSEQRRAATTAPPKVKEKKKYDGNTDFMISTGSTLLDLAISGGRIRGGGVPGGILLEAFGPSGSGKTVLLCEMAGAVQRAGGAIMFQDPEARLNKTFAQIFDLDTKNMAYECPDTVTGVFSGVREWDVKESVINGIFTDSLAALSTDMEMDKDEGDKMGMRRAKEFSEQLRRTCRVITKRNLLMVCSNQIRENADAGNYGPKTSSTGGKAIGFYASVRLRFSNPEKIWDKVKVAGKEVKRVIGIETTVDVFKNSVWKPYRTAPLTIIFDYGIDDIRQNLQFIKDYTKHTTYTVGGESLSNSMAEAIQMVEERKLVKVLKEEVIDLWEVIESKFEKDRKKKDR